MLASVAYLGVDVRNALALLAVEAHVDFRVAEVLPANERGVVGSFLVGSGRGNLDGLEHVSFQTY